MKSVNLTFYSAENRIKSAVTHLVTTTTTIDPAKKAAADDDHARPTLAARLDPTRVSVANVGDVIRSENYRENNTNDLRLVLFIHCLLNLPFKIFANT